jgi:hypothetical protein
MGRRKRRRRRRRFYGNTHVTLLWAPMASMSF